MGKNRDKLGLVAAILEAATAGANKTRIMYMANLSFKLLEKYLSLTLNAGFLQREGSNYTLTEKGEEFLKRFSHFHDKNSKIEKSIKDLVTEREVLEQLCHGAEGSRPNQD